MIPVPHKRTYTVAEAAAVLGVTSRTVRAMLADGRLRGLVRVGGRRVLGASLWARRRWPPRRPSRAHASMLA